MKRIITLLPILLIGICATVKAQTATRITIENKSNEQVYLQPEDTTGYNKLETGTTVMTLHLKTPRYYTFIGKNMKFRPLFITPGNTIKIIYDESGTTISGDNSNINQFIKDNHYVCQAPQDIVPYSAEWIRYNDDKIKELDEKLDQSGLSPEFIAIHKQYIRFIYLNQRLNGMQMLKMFGQSNIELPANYYDFLKELRFDDENILFVPKWFKVVNSAMEEMEKQGIIAVSNEHYMQLYAAKIGNEKVRSHFLINLLKFTLEKGYSDDFMTYLKSVKPLITDQEALAGLPGLIETFNQAKEKNKNILRGMKMPEFTANSVDGKEYKLSDFKGKVVIIDFWFTGCIPCKAEMPYYDKLAEEMQGKPIQFLSVSLDTGNQLMATWKKMMEEKDGKSPVLNVNLPQGFKSDFAANMNIRSVPRIVLVDKDGNIVDAYAKRPSDPKLKEQINTLLNGSDNKEKMNAAIQKMVQASGSYEKEKVLNEFIQENHGNPNAASALGMMYFYYCQSLAAEGRNEVLIETVGKTSPDNFKRDLSFVSAATCWDNKNKETAEILARQAAELTLKMNENKKPEGEELQKYIQILSFYGTVLIDCNKTDEAAPYVLKAYEVSENPYTDLKINYLAILMNQKKYAEAKPFLEELIQAGMSNEKYEKWLEEAYIAEKGSAKGYEDYLASQKKVYEEELKQQIAKDKLNETAPLFTLKNMKGEDVSLADLKGKIVLLDFWATWCGPCKQSFPAMQKVVNKYKKDKEVVFLFIDTWDKNQKSAADFLKSNNYDFELLFDTDKSDVAKQYKLTGIPAKILIDKEGIIRYSLKGFSGSDEKNLMELSAMIESLR